MGSPIGRTELGNWDQLVSENLFGINVLRDLPPILPNKDHHGFTFFTRPQLNLSTINISNVRYFLQMLTDDEVSIPRYVRATLDPRLQRGIKETEFGTNFYRNEQKDCPLVDRNNPFIPILSNLLTNISGWPDMVTPTYTSSAGMRKEQFAMVDGTFEIFDVFDLNCTFKNIINEPLTMLFQVWNQYPSLVHEGKLHPYLDFLVENEFDYFTRIYRFITDPSGRFITKAACTGAAFPTNMPFGKFFDYSNDTPYTDQTKEINITFKCMGALYNDIKIFVAYNKVMSYFNPEVDSYLKGEICNLEKIPYDLLPELNHRAYPIINIAKNEIEWLVRKDDKVYRNMLIKQGNWEKDQDVTELENLVQTAEQANQKDISNFDLFKSNANDTDTTDLITNFY